MNEKVKSLRYYKKVEKLYSNLKKNSETLCGMITLENGKNKNDKNNNNDKNDNKQVDNYDGDVYVFEQIWPVTLCVYDEFPALSNSNFTTGSSNSFTTGMIYAFITDKKLGELCYVFFEDKFVYKIPYCSKLVNDLNRKLLLPKNSEKVYWDAYKNEVEELEKYWNK